VWFTRQARRHGRQSGRRSNLFALLGTMIVLGLVFITSLAALPAIQDEKHHWRPGPMEWMVLFVLAVLLYGKRLPELGRWLVKRIRKGTDRV